jgi:hypothetical protein
MLADCERERSPLAAQRVAAPTADAVAGAIETTGLHRARFRLRDNVRRRADFESVPTTISDHSSARACAW